MADGNEFVNGVQGISPDFEWNPDYDALLEQIASTDYVDSEWTRLRDMLKYRIEKNIAEYLSNTKSTESDSSSRSPESNPTLSPRTITSGGLRLPPFAKREPSQYSRNELNSHGPRKAFLTEDEAREMKDTIFAQLHEFEGKPPYTIQRMCELALRPRQHYGSVGKYLRAVEKSLLVTSTWDAFPLGPEDKDGDALTPAYASAGALREATTPLFSPIPFLHDDARRSRSRSPPLSPLELAARRQLSPHPGDARAAAAAAGAGALPDLDGPVIGLVDELDDPGPGHMSDHPTALTAAGSEGTRPLHGSLEERFVKGAEEGGAVGGDGAESKQQDEEDHEVEDMVLDEPDDDKENKNKD